MPLKQPLETFAEELEKLGATLEVLKLDEALLDDADPQVKAALHELSHKPRRLPDTVWVDEGVGMGMGDDDEGLQGGCNMKSTCRRRGCNDKRFVYGVHKEAW